jgi:DNA topoisomerase-1
MSDILEALNSVLGDHLFPPLTDGRDNRECPECHKGRLNLKLGRFGAFIACSSYPDCRYTRQIGDSSEVNGEGDNAGGDMLEQNEPRFLGKDAVSGLDVTVRKGPYGFYLQLGEAVKGSKTKPKRITIPAPYTSATIPFETALGLLSLPREVGLHPETGKTISAAIGRFGPYLLHDGAYTSLPKGDDVLTIGINRAVSVLAEKGAKKERKAVEPLRIIGAHPADGKDIAVYDGRYGPYVKHNKINASLPKNTAIEAVTLEQAVGLLADQREKKKK